MKEAGLDAGSSQDLSVDCHANGKTSWMTRFPPHLYPASIGASDDLPIAAGRGLRTGTMLIGISSRYEYSCGAQGKHPNHITQSAEDYLAYDLLARLFK
jgi:hypothetical protein